MGNDLSLAYVKPSELQFNDYEIFTKLTGLSQDQLKDIFSQFYQKNSSLLFCHKSKFFALF